MTQRMTESEIRMMHKVELANCIVNSIARILDDLPYIGKFMKHRFENLSQDAIELRRLIAFDKAEEKGNLESDEIRTALKTAGYQNVDSMNQFERASALLDMAQELSALAGKRVTLGELMEE